MDDDPDSLLYRPPGDTPRPEGSPLPGAERRYVGKVFLGWVVGLSIVTGVIESLDGGAALNHFGAGSLVAAAVALGASRLHGAGVTLSAAVIALVSVVHRRSARGAEPPGRDVFWPTLVAAPVAALIAAFGMTLVALVMASLVFDVPAVDSWRMVGSLVRFEDLFVGPVIAALLAVALGGVAPGVGRALAAVRGRLLWKIVIALVVTRGLTFGLNEVWSALSSPLDSRIPGLGQAMEGD